MLRAMFGMGGTEILVILIVALLFLGPDKLPEAARSISKGIRDIKKQSRVLQRTIEDDEHIGGAIRDLKSALRGEDEPVRPQPRPRKELESGPEGGPEGGPTAVAALAHGAAEGATDPYLDPHIDTWRGVTSPAGEPGAAALPAGEPAAADPGATPAAAAGLTLPSTAGEADDTVPAASASDDAELAAMVKPVANTIAHTPGKPGAKQGQD
jgi:sec-independent protein translocase protein TatB